MSSRIDIIRLDWLPGFFQYVNRTGSYQKTRASRQSMAISQSAVLYHKRRNVIDFEKIDRFFVIFRYNSVGHLRIYLGKTTYFKVHWPLKRYSFLVTGYIRWESCNYNIGLFYDFVHTFFCASEKLNLIPVNVIY